MLKFCVQSLGCATSAYAAYLAQGAMEESLSAEKVPPVERGFWRLVTVTAVFTLGAAATNGVSVVLFGKDN